MADTTVAVSSMLADLQPIIVAAVGAVVTAGVALLVSAANKYLGLKVSEADVAAANDYLAGLAQRAVAAAEGNLATAKIDVHSELVARLANEALDNGPAVLAKLGFGPDDIAHKIAAAIGNLQAGMTRVTVAAPAPAPVAAAK